jgi:hypothetical protein
MKVKAKQLREKINGIQTPGTFFSITTISRETGKIRTFNASFAYGKYLKGGESRYDFDEKNLLVIWDQSAYHKMIRTGKGTAIRTVNCDDIIHLQCLKKVLIKNGEPTNYFYSL